MSWPKRMEADSTRSRYSRSHWSTSTIRQRP
jgi:hypothetical protein